jgi:hypothetical protein
MTPLIFIKFGAKDHIEALLRKGAIYMRSILDFKKNSENKQRYDKFEGSLSNHYLTNGVIQLKPVNEGEWKNLQFVEANFNNNISDKSILSYSLYTINKEDFEKGSELSIDYRMKEFGSHLLLIRNTREFIDRIKMHFAAGKMESCCNYVNYYDPKHNHDSLTLFHKPDELSHQKEFRILTKNVSASPITFSIGNLKQFAEVFSTEGLEDFRFRLPCG